MSHVFLAEPRTEVFDRSRDLERYVAVFNGNYWRFPIMAFDFCRGSRLTVGWTRNGGESGS